MKLIYKGDDDFDLICGDVTIELDYRETSGWTLWNVNYAGTRFGGAQPVGPGAMHDWLTTHAQAAVEEAIASTRKQRDA